VLTERGSRKSSLDMSCQAGHTSASHRDAPSSLLLGRNSGTKVGSLRLPTIRRFHEVEGQDAAPRGSLSGHICLRWYRPWYRTLCPMSPSRARQGTRGRTGTGPDIKCTPGDRLGAERSQVQILSPRSEAPHLNAMSQGDSRFAGRYRSPFSARRLRRSSSSSSRPSRARTSATAVARTPSVSPTYVSNERSI
jgi:hypothetical protein